MTEPNQDSPGDPQLSSLYRRDATDEPSKAVDARILAAARVALGSPPAKARRGAWWQRWRTPLALATTLALTLTLALLQERQPRESPVERLLPQEVSPARHDAPSHDASERPSPAFTPEPARPAVPSRRPGEVRAKAVPPSVDADASSSQPRSEIAVEQGLATTAKSQALSAAAPAAAALDSAPAPAAAVIDSPAQKRVEAAAAGRMAPPAPAKSASGRPASVWIDEIRALRRAGKNDEAERQLREFRRTHPDYPLPEEFRQ